LKNRGFIIRTGLAFLFFIAFAPLYSQTAARLETLLEKPAITWSDAAAFVLEASDTAVSNPADAFRYAMEHQWLPKNAAIDDTVRLNGISLLLMRSFNMKGGIFFNLFKSPHHAYRELVYRGVIRSETDPDMAVSGQQMLLMVSRLLAIKERTAPLQQEAL